MPDDPESRVRKRPLPPESGRFRPGTSGNPGGRPKSAPIAAAYRRFLRMPLEKIQSLDPARLTGAELIALATLKAAWKGKTMAAVEATDRSEGKVPAPIDLDVTAEFDFQAAIAEAHRRAHAFVEARTKESPNPCLRALPAPTEPDRR